jgi:hypothetical protein
MAALYDITMYRQHRQIRSHIGLKSMKDSKMVAKTGNISWQYLTDGFS